HRRYVHRCAGTGNRVGVAVRRCTYRRWSWLAAVAVLILATVGFVPAASAVGLPTVTSLSPQSGSVNGGQVLVITGTNLDGATAVNFGSTVVNPPFPYDPSTGGVLYVLTPAGTGT